MKKLNKSGFTLIELLAVIVILGVVMGIAIPSITSLISNTRKDAYIRTSQAFIGGARNMAISDTNTMMPAIGKKTYISLSEIQLEKGGITSPFGGKIDKVNSYVMITGTGTLERPDYTYSILITEEGGKFGISSASDTPISEAQLDTVSEGRPFVKPTVTATFPAGTAGDIICKDKTCNVK